LKLLHKLLILVLSLSVFPLGLVGWQSLQGLQSEIDVSLQAIFKEKVSSNGRLIENQMEGMVKKVVEAVHFRQLGSMNREEMGRFAKDLLRQFEELRIVTVLDEMGEEVLSALAEGEVSPLEVQLHLQSLTPKMIESVFGEKKRFSEIVLRGGVPMVTLYTPFSFNDRPAKGVVAIAVSLSSVQQLIEEIEFSKSQEGRILLFDQSGQLMAGKGDEFSELKKSEQIPFIQQAFEMKKSVPASTGVYSDLKGMEYLGAYSFLSNSLGWLLLMSEPKKEVFASADLLFDRTVGMILVTVVLSILGGLMMARVIIRPLKALVKGAEEIGSGNLSYRIKRSSSDEIGKLCDSFTSMGENLQNREETIGRIRGIAAELNSLFEREKVLQTGSSALCELIPEVLVNIWILDGETWTSYKSDLALVDPLWPSWEETQLMEGEQQSLWVPLGKRDRNGEWTCKGMMELQREDFSVLDQQVAQILGAAMAISMVNIEFLMESVVNERRAHELELAELVQKTLYPDCDPSTDDFELGSFLVSSSETGGDWYGYIKSEDGKKLSVLIGDVTGHGAPAALITAATNAFFKTVEHLRSMAQDKVVDIDLHDPVFLLRLLNRVITETARGRLVMTFFISTIDMDTGVMRYANAGHNAPWVLRANASREILFDDDPAAAPVESAVKKEGGKIKIKIGGKKNKGEDLAPPLAADSKPAAIEEPIAAVEPESISEPSAEAPKKKLKIKLGGKKTTAVEGQGPTWENINARGMRLGEVLDVEFECHRTRLFKGDVMVWYTDGWIENTNAEMEEFGKKRCQKILESHSHLSPTEMIEKLREASWEYYGDFPREDDVTIVIGKVLGDWGDKS
jgi:serine phosphatase RsbU (regulator of sigma subunit)/HAMP domain-containing protein